MNRKLTATACIASAVLVTIAFTALGSTFDHPDVLKEPARVVLERFREHQGSVSFWFAVLAFSAALFAPIAIGVGKLRSNRAMRIAVPIGIAAAVVQTIGLLRWPALVPGFASSAASATAATAADAEAHFRTASTLLGTVLGETFGYALTAAWTLLVVKSLGSRFSGRAFTWVGAIAAAMVFIGVLSPLDVGAIDTANFAGYIVWSVWLVWLGVALFRGAGASETAALPVHAGARQPVRV